MHSELFSKTSLLLNCMRLGGTASRDTRDTAETKRTVWYTGRVISILLANTTAVLLLLARVKRRAWSTNALKCLIM